MPASAERVAGYGKAMTSWRLIVISDQATMGRTYLTRPANPSRSRHADSTR